VADDTLAGEPAECHDGPQNVEGTQGSCMSRLTLQRNQSVEAEYFWQRNQRVEVDLEEEPDAYGSVETGSVEAVEAGSVNCHES
jgi:hypothetical protein